jgi:transcriptional regulator with XRE-family HTH domain
VCNNRLRRARTRLGLTQDQLGARIGVTGATISQLESLRYSPISKNLTGWKPVARKLAIFFGVDEWDLFPPDIIEATDKPTRAVRELSAEQLAQMVPGRGLPQALPSPLDELVDKNMREQLAKCVKCLKPRQEMVVRMYHGLDPYHREHSFTEIGEALGIDKGVAAAHYQNGMRTLRHPSITKHIRAFVEND